MKLLCTIKFSLFCNVAISSKLRPRMDFPCTEKNIYMNDIDLNFHDCFLPVSGDRMIVSA